MWPLRIFRTGAPEEPSSFFRGKGISLAFLSLGAGTKTCRISCKASRVLEADADGMMVGQGAPPSCARARDPPPLKGLAGSLFVRHEHYTYKYRRSKPNTSTCRQTKRKLVCSSYVGATE